MFVPGVQCTGFGVAIAGAQQVCRKCLSSLKALFDATFSFPPDPFVASQHGNFVVRGFGHGVHESGLRLEPARAAVPGVPLIVSRREGHAVVERVIRLSR